MGPVKAEWLGSWDEKLDDDTRVSNGNGCEWNRGDFTQNPAFGPSVSEIGIFR